MGYGRTCLVAMSLKSDTRSCWAHSQPVYRLRVDPLSLSLMSRLVQTISSTQSCQSCLTLNWQSFRVTAGASTKHHGHVMAMFITVVHRQVQSGWATAQALHMYMCTQMHYHSTTSLYYKTQSLITTAQYACIHTHACLSRLFKDGTDVLVFDWPLVVRLPTHSKWSHLPWGGLPSGRLHT